MNPKVSVILPIKKYRPGMVDSIESVLAQSYPNIEIIILSIESSKDFKDLVDQKKLQVYACNSKNKSRNMGVRLASGQYVLHMDDDMVLSKDLVAECVDILEKGEYQAVSIPENINTQNFFERVLCLEKKITETDNTVVSPRFLSKELYNKVGGICEELDPIDEGDLKERLLFHKCKFTITKNCITLNYHQPNLLKRFKNKYKIGSKLSLFREMHQNSKQADFMHRFKNTIKSFSLIKIYPLTFFGLIFLKFWDLLAIKLGDFSNVTSTELAKLKPFLQKILDFFKNILF